MLIIKEDGNIELKLIIGACTTDKIDPNIPHNGIYYNNPWRWDHKTNTFIIENEEQRYKNEYYQAIRTLMMCFLYLKFRKGEEYGFYDNKYSKNENPSVQELIEILELMKEEFKNENNEEFNLILDFI